MAIPTQFSVTSTRSSPIANPSAPQDAPQPFDAENVSIVGGADVLSSLSSGGVDTPSALNSEGGVNIDTPSVLTPKSGTLLLPPFPLNHARILWNNTLRINQNVATNNGIGGINTLKPNTWEKWRFTNGGEIIFTLTDPRLLDTVCIGAHNIGGLSAGIGVEHSATLDGDDFAATFPGKDPSTNEAIMFHRVSKVNVRRLKIIISGNGDFEIGFISAGSALQMQRPFFNGHTPITDSDVTDYYSNRTESGEIIGQQIRRKGYETSADWQNLDDAWYREYFSPFKQAAKLRPFFFAWNLLEYPEDVGFCRISQDISAPMQNGTRTKRSINMKLLGAG